MYIFNITFLVSEPTIPLWNDWVRNLFIPSTIASGTFHSPQLAQIRSADQTDGVSFALQFRTTSMDSIETWLNQYEHELHNICSRRFQGNVLFFTTTLELLH